MKLRITITGEYEPVLDHYRNVEWPADSGERKDLTEPSDIAAYDQHLLDCGHASYDDLLGDDVVCRVEAVEEPQTMEAPSPGGNPFLDNDPDVTEEERRAKLAKDAEKDATAGSSGSSESDSWDPGEPGAKRRPTAGEYF
jgi:hypothetical protein